MVLLVDLPPSLRIRGHFFFVFPPPPPLSCTLKKKQMKGDNNNNPNWPYPVIRRMEQTKRSEWQLIKSSRNEESGWIGGRQEGGDGSLIYL